MLTGGSLLIGVSDSGEVVGIEHDFQTLRSKPNRDGWELAFTQAMANHLGEDAAAGTIAPLRGDGQAAQSLLCGVHLDRSPPGLRMARRGNSSRASETRPAHFPRHSSMPTSKRTGRGRARRWRVGPGGSGFSRRPSRRSGSSRRSRRRSRAEPLEPEPLEPEPPGVEPEPLEPEPELSSVRTRSPPLSSPGSAGAIWFVSVPEVVVRVSSPPRLRRGAGAAADGACGAARPSGRSRARASRPRSAARRRGRRCRPRSSSRAGRCPPRRRGRRWRGQHLLQDDGRSSRLEASSARSRFRQGESQLSVKPARRRGSPRRGRRPRAGS